MILSIYYQQILVGTAVNLVNHLSKMFLLFAKQLKNFRVHSWSLGYVVIV